MRNKIKALGIIFNLILASFAFAMIISGVGVVDAGVTYTTGSGNYPANPTVGDYAAFDQGNSLYTLSKYDGKQWNSVSSGGTFTKNQVESITSDTPTKVEFSEKPSATPAPARVSRTSNKDSVMSSAGQYYNLYKMVDSGSKGAAVKDGTYSSGTIKAGSKEYAATVDSPVTVKTTGTSSIVTQGTESSTVSSSQLSTETGLSTATATGTSVNYATSSQYLAKVWPETFAAGSWGSAIVGGLQWAAIAYFAGQLIGNMLGLQKGQTNALSWGMAAGFGTYEFLASLESTSALWGGMFAPVIGIVVGAVVFALTYKETSQKIVTFTCYPWEAPTGGDKCEECNSELHSCSLYRCNSLGQSCAFLNAGTSKEMCANNATGDVNSPIMKSWSYPLNSKYSYKPNSAVRPPDNGVKVVNSEASDGCLKAFTPLTIGLVTNEPAQCKVSFNRTMKYSDMSYFMGGSNLYAYNHTETLNLPGPQSIEDDLGLTLPNNGVYNLYVRCKDINGNENTDLFIYNFCVEAGPDVTPPKIEDTSIISGMPVQFGLNSTYLEVYTNEPASCKWSRDTSLSYDRMEKTMKCSEHVYEMNARMLYKCTTTLDGLQNAKDNIFYFKCKDQPWLGNSSDRNENQEYQFILKGSANTLAITKVSPNGTIEGSGSVAPVNLELKTEYGSNKGNASCYYSPTTVEKDYIAMLETNNNIHKQTLYLTSGSYTYYFQCIDLGGNAAKNSTSFAVAIDKKAPEVVRVYNEAGKLKVVTDEISTCSYSTNDERACLFLLPDGTNMPRVNSTDHYAEWKENSYYIKCVDQNGNQPESNLCSIVVKPQ